jgi:hypothetical protein
MISKRESSKYYTVHYVADAPRRRDFLRVLLGRWKPKVRRVKRLTMAGLNRELKRAWTGPKMEQALYAQSTLLQDLPERGQAIVPIKRDES